MRASRRRACVRVVERCVDAAEEDVVAGVEARVARGVDDADLLQAAVLGRAGLRHEGGGAGACERRDQERQQRGPDPVARMPRELSAPGSAEPRNDAGGLDRQPEPTLEAVLLARLVRRPAPWTEWPMCYLRAGRPVGGRRRFTV